MMSTSYILKIPFQSNQHISKAITILEKQVLLKSWIINHIQKQLAQAGSTKQTPWQQIFFYNMESQVTGLNIKSYLAINTMLRLYLLYENQNSYDKHVIMYKQVNWKVIEEWIQRKKDRFIAM